MGCMQTLNRVQGRLSGKTSRRLLAALLIATLSGGCKKGDGSAESSENADAGTAQRITLTNDANDSPVNSDTPSESPSQASTAPRVAVSVKPAAIPEIRTDVFEPVVQKQLNEAIDAAKASPSSAEAVGKLAMLLDSYNLRKEACELYQSASALDPNSFRWAYLGGRMLFFEGQGEKAVEFLSRASELDLDDIPCQVALINALINVERLQDAGERAAKLVEKHREHPLANFLLGSINLKLKAPVFAMEYLKPVFVQFPDMGGVRREMAATLDMLGQTEKAEKVRAVEVGNNRIPTIEDPHHEAVLKLAIGTNVENERGAFALMRGDAVAAKEHFTNALRLSPGNVPARVGLADSLLRLGEFDGCEGMLRPLVKGGNESLAGTVLLAKLRIAQERYDEAEALIEKAKDLGANRDHILKLQFSVAEATKDLTKTVALLEELIKEDPGSADKHAELGNVYVLSQRPDDAEREYMKAIELEPRHAGAMEGLGALYTLRGESDAARTWYLRAFESGGRAPRTLVLAARDALDRGDYARGLAILSQAYAMYPKNPEIGDTLSRTYSTCPDPAVRDWEKAMRIALEIYGDDEETMPLVGLHTLGAAHAEAGNFDEAMRLMDVGVDRASEIDDSDSILRFNKSKRQYSGHKHDYDPIVIPHEYE